MGWNFRQTAGSLCTTGNPTRHAEKSCANYRLIRTSLSTFKTNRTRCAIKDILQKLKVPSHQIRLALKWYGWIDFYEYKNRGWETEV
jgi:hypothetical protein